MGSNPAAPTNIFKKYQEKPSRYLVYLVFSRRNQAELKQDLKLESARYKRCAYCENPLKFRDSHIDHITPVSKGGLGTLSNKVLVCSKCNLSKRAKTLRRFCADSGLDNDKVIARLEWGGKDV